MNCLVGPGRMSGELLIYPIGAATPLIPGTEGVPEEETTRSWYGRRHGRKIFLRHRREEPLTDEQVKAFICMDDAVMAVEAADLLLRLSSGRPIAAGR
ncbi:hypothetical protein [Mesorhizobium sp. L103C131B0]|uniref:hypothetical protein n=1 Tax=Mesorhizobium sp. L103C131B0 TaxID=1287089 RepID=UPI0012DEA631|nr:hypothetical protein [Mesorhizobium sp. L103C131B0]